jgi:hypothetical protein
VSPLVQENVNRGVALHIRTVCESTDGPTRRPCRHLRVRLTPDRVAHGKVGLP